MITLDIPSHEQATIQYASRMAGVSVEQFLRSSAMEKAKQFVQKNNSSIQEDKPSDFVSEAWLAGQGLFGCFDGSPDLSEKAKSIAKQNIERKYAQRTS